MKKTVYLVRHGQTFFNKMKKIQGWCDSPLTDIGRKQAEIAKEYFINNNVTIDSAYSSTSERACDTLEILTDQDYTRVKGLKEWNFGILEAEHEYINPPLPYGDFFVTYGGEGEAEFKNRVADTLMDIVQKDTGETILAVSHGAACRQFMRYWAHESSIDQEAPLANCCILIFEFENDLFRLREIVNHDYTVLNR
ncbi:MAG: histidine phosphatase family protein [Alkalibacterium sp.]|nr:histidine phosphatase family protein [Alkalibacterium sp.]